MAAKKHDADASTSAVDAAFTDAIWPAVVIATRHDSHARLTCRALRAGKHVFVEKPLAISLEELEAIAEARKESVTSHGETPMLMVGFNRRFAPLVQRMKRLLQGVSEPKYFIVTVNAGAVSPDHWTKDPEVGGGRIIGEACHFIDLLRHLAGAPIAGHELVNIGRLPRHVAEDSVIMTFTFTDGSVGSIHYLANGHSSFPKERVEVFTAGRTLQLDNFRRLTSFGWPGFSTARLWRQDKGQNGCVRTFLDSVRAGAECPIAFDELVEVSTVTIELAARIRAWGST